MYLNRICALLVVYVCMYVYAIQTDPPPAACCSGFRVQGLGLSKPVRTSFAPPALMVCKAIQPMSRSTVGGTGPPKGAEVIGEPPPPRASGLRTFRQLHAQMQKCRHFVHARNACSLVMFSTKELLNKYVHNINTLMRKYFYVYMCRCIFKASSLLSRICSRLGLGMLQSSE